MMRTVALTCFFCIATGNVQAQDPISLEELEIIFADNLRENLRDATFLKQQVIVEKAQYTLAQQRLSRAEGLLVNNAVSKLEVRAARRDSQVAQHRVAWAEHRLKKSATDAAIDTLRMRWIKGEEERDIAKLRSLYQMSWDAECSGDRSLRDAASARLRYAEHDLALSLRMTPHGAVSENEVDEKKSTVVSQKARYDAFALIVEECEGETLENRLQHGWR